jgi:hypothetical protein
LFAACSPEVLKDFATPEKAYQTLHHAVSTNDMDLYSKCFLKAEDRKMITQLQSAGGFPKTVKFVDYEVLNKEMINESEVNLRIREVGERRLSADEPSYHFISIALVEYRKTSEGWKVYSYTTESVKKAKKVGDKYVPTE